MAETAATPRPAPSVQLAWRHFAGKRVIVHAPNGGYAARRAPALLREADQAVEALERLLAPSDEHRTTPAEIFLTEPQIILPSGRANEHGDRSHPMPGDAIGAAIVRVIQPESPGEP